MGTDLRAYLDGTGCPRGVADVIDRLARTAIELAELIAGGDAALAAERSDKGGGDHQIGLDLVADELFAGCLAGAPVHSLASEERVDVTLLDPGAAVAVAIDPLDGSSNLAANAAVGTIFTLFPAGAAGDPGDPFRAAGTAQLAAGVVMYGPATTMALTVGAGTACFVADRRVRTWRLATARLAIPDGTPEYAINASNRRHWPAGLRTYVDDLVAGEDGPRGIDFNMRWNAALVAETHRILGRGGIFLYPADDRDGYRRGRLRLLYEAFPVALLVEQAGGAATDGRSRILDGSLGAAGLHQRTPLVFGSPDKVARVATYLDTTFPSDHAPLFAARGLFRS